MNLFKSFEFRATFDSQEDSDNSDNLFHRKFQFYDGGKSAIAIGGNLQLLKTSGKNYSVVQIYLAATYAGNFLDTSAETTIVIGKHFRDDETDYDDDNIDFSLEVEIDFF